MKVPCFIFLLAISTPCFSHTGSGATLSKITSIPDSSLYYALTPAETEFHDSTYTYFLFLPNQQVCWFLSSLPPQQQDISEITGLVAGPLPYEWKQDTLKFHRTFYDITYKQSLGDMFSCAPFEGGMDVILDERLASKMPGTQIHYSFSLFRKK